MVCPKLARVAKQTGKRQRDKEENGDRETQNKSIQAQTKGETDRQTDTQTGRQADRQRQRERQTDTQTHIDIQTDRQTDRQTDKQTARQTENNVPKYHCLHVINFSTDGRILGQEDAVVLQSSQSDRQYSDLTVL